MEEIIKKLTLVKSHVKPKVAAVITCRVNSTRLFGKPLQIVGGYSILHLLVKQIEKARLVDEIVLAISKESGNEIFIEFAKKHKLKFIIGDEEDTLERIIKGAKSVNAKIVFRKTSEDPFIYWEMIDDLIKHHIKHNFDISIVEDIPLGSGYEIINLKSLEICNRLCKTKKQRESWPRFLANIKKLKIYRHVSSSKLRRPDLRITVDTPEDLIVVRLIHQALGNRDKPIALMKIIEFLHKNPFVSKINSSVPLGVSRI